MSTRSMTGFARVRKTAADGEIAVSIKSVNHRGLDVHFHMAAELDPFEGAIRNAVKAKVARGHLQIHVVFNRTAPADASSLNRPLLRAYLQAFREAADEFRECCRRANPLNPTPVWSRRCSMQPRRR
jgi:uncharacterized protein (TIGR00255 family)